MKKNKISALLVILLVVTLPIAVSGQIIKSDVSGQIKNIGNTLDNQLSGNPSITDAIGEDIVLSIGQYQPTILRSGLIEDQGAPVYATLIGVSSNPTVTIPKINGIDIVSQSVTTIPEGLPVSVSRVAYIPPQAGVRTLSNMGTLVAFINRIPREADVPDEITINLDARVRFDVSSGLGASPTKMVLREESFGDWSGHKSDNKYLDVYINAQDVGDDYVILDIYDDNGNAIAQDVKIKLNDKPKIFSRTPRLSGIYAPRQLFDKFAVDLRTIKGSGKTIDILVIKDSLIEKQTISEGEAVYPGSGIILEKIDETPTDVIAIFRDSNNNRQEAKFPKKKFDTTFSIDAVEESTQGPRIPTPGVLGLVLSFLNIGYSSDVQCNGKKLVDVITKVAESIENFGIGDTDEVAVILLQKGIGQCVDIPLTGTGKMTSSEAKAIRTLLLEIQGRAVSNRFNEAATLAGSLFNKFNIKYNDAYPSENLAFGTTAPNDQALELYKLAVAEYDTIASTYNGEIIKFKDNTNTDAQLLIADFYAQYNKAILYDTKLSNPYMARQAYKELLDIFHSYTDLEKIKQAKTLIDESTIQDRLALIDSVLGINSAAKTIAQVKMQEANGDSISILLADSNARDFAIERKTSTATINLAPPSPPDSNPLKVTEGAEIPFSPQRNIHWRVKQILADAIIITTSSTGTSSTSYQDIKIAQGQIGANVQIKANPSITQHITLENTELYKEAHIVVSPNIEGAFSGAHFSMHLPIDKRALDLPLFSDSIGEEINKTQALIQKLDEVIAKVGKVHDTWKKFCFGVFAAIAAWNFVKAAFGSGEGRAKQDASEIFWNQYGDSEECKSLTFDECVFAHQDDYDKILATTEKAYEAGEAAGKPGATYQSPLGEISVTDKNKEDVKELARLKSISGSNPGDNTTREKYFIAQLNLQNNADLEKLIKEQGAQNSVLSSAKQQNVSAWAWVKKQQHFEKLKAENAGDKAIINKIEIADSLIANYNNLQVPENNLIKKEVINDDLKRAIQEAEKQRLLSAGLAANDSDAETQVNELFNQATHLYVPPNGRPIYFKPQSGGLVAMFLEAASGSSTFTAIGDPGVKVIKGGTGTQFAHNPSVTYYEDGPNKGRVHRRTLDAFRYAEIKYTTGGGIESIYILSRTSPNAQIKGDSSETGVNDGPLDVVKKNAKDTGDTALLNSLSSLEGCITQLNNPRASARDIVSCGGSSYKVTNDPEPRGTACVDFYSPSQCKLLFNACDPVLCPASRCDLGGTWRVKDDNVIQTGLIGSSLLCLSNFGIPGTDITWDGGQVIMPICITGIYAGLQDIQTVLMEYSDCLNRAVVSGESVGVCDLIRSYYICDILWKEAVAIFNIKGGVLGKALKFINGEDEGTEYTDFDASMDTAVNGLEYFTQNYAKNTFAQFSGGSLPEVGAEICKSAMFGKLPGIGSFTEQILRPESPPQFTALLDKVPYQDISGQPESEYQVYYRIFAGANEPITFSVYLKFQDLQGGGAVLPLIPNRALQAGAFSADTVTFRAPDVYNQVCVSYSSPTFGYREECGFGKTSSGFALEYAANEIAKKQAKEAIQTAEDCAPSGSRFTSPSSNFINNAGKIIAGGFATGVLETGLIRVCSGVSPGDEKEWMQVGECWEDGPNQGRNLGYCWLHMPTAEKIVSEYSTNEQLTIAEFNKNISALSKNTIDDMAEYAKKLGIDIGFLSEEDITQAKTDIDKELDKGTSEGYNEAAKIYKNLIDSPVVDSAQILEFRLKLAEVYKDWASSIEKSAP